MKGPVRWWRGLKNTSEPACSLTVAALLILSGGLALLLVWQAAMGRFTHFVSLWPVAAALILSVSTLALARWWAKPHTAAWPDLHPASLRANRWTALFAAAAIGLSIWPRLAPLQHSLSGSEIGDLSRQSSQLHSFPTASSTGAAPFRTGASFERNARPVSLGAGLATAALLTLLGAALGGPRFGLTAGLLLALHPTHVHWSTTLGSPALPLLAGCAATFCLLRALQTNRWQWWLFLAAALAATLLARPSWIALPMAILAGGLTAISLSATPRAIRLSHLSRLAVAAVLAAIPVLLVFSIGTQPFPFPTAATELAGLPGMAGTPWQDAGFLLSGVDPASQPPDFPWKTWAALGLAATGALAFLRQPWPTRLIPGILLAAPALTFLVNPDQPATAAGCAIPGLMLCLVNALFFLARLAPRRLAALPLFGVVLFSVLTKPTLQQIGLQPPDPVREAAAALSGQNAAPLPSIPAIAAAFGPQAEALRFYRPEILIPSNPAALSLLTARAHREKRPLLLVISAPAALPASVRDLGESVTSDPSWQFVSSLAGWNPLSSYALYRYAPDAMDRLPLRPTP